MLRLFIALPLPDDLKEHLGAAQESFRRFGGRVSWVAPKNMHLTVRFLGDTDDRLVPDLAKLLDRVAERHGRLTLTLDKLGAFPKMQRPRVFWAGFDGDLTSVGEMASQIEEGVCQLGFERERKRFRPHLTIARVRDSYGIDPLIESISTYQLQPISVLLSRLVLYKSTLTPRGPIYDVLHEAALTGL